MRRSKEIKAAIILLIIHTSAAKPNKDTAPAVFEVINEQARIDEKRTLPYANPLAGNSQQNAKIHAQHQQAMFDAERRRQHRAQLQRWNMQPPRQQVDSYMKAYQESQENHHLALEQMQSTLKEKKTKRQEHQLKDIPEIEPVKITIADAIDKNRNQRSYGSAYPNLHKKRKVYAYPGPSYDQGVTIKPNGIVGLYNVDKERRSLYTVAIPSKTQYVYPKLYSQTHEYQSGNDINALNTLFNKLPQKQLTQLNTLTNTAEEPDKETLNKPIDLYFYVNHPNIANVESTQTVSKPYAPEYITHKDHIPITEEIDDVPDVREARKQAYFRPIAPTVVTHLSDDTQAVKNNYYNIQAEQTVTSELPKTIEYISPETPTIETITYEKPLNVYHHGPSTEEVKYLKTPTIETITYEKPLTVYHHGPSTEGVKYLKSKPTAVQHLSQDGTGVSAYGDSDVSIHKIRKKRDIDSTLFILGNETLRDEKTVVVNYTEALNQTINLEINCTVTVKNINNTNIGNSTLDFETDDSLPKSEEFKRAGYVEYDNSHRIGEAYDYDYTYDEDDPNSKLDYSYENNDDYEYNIPDFDYDPPGIRAVPTHRPRQRNPNINEDTDGSFSNRYSNFRHPNFYDYHSDQTNRDYRPPKQKYGPPRQQYGVPKQHYGPPKQQYGPPKQQYGVPTQQYNAPSQHFGTPNQQYAPLQYDSGNQYVHPSSTYGLPLEQYGPPFNQRLNPTPEYGQISDPTSQSYPASHVSSVIDTLEPVYMLTQTQLKELVGQKLNIEHLDVFQLTHGKKSKRPRKHKSRRRYPKKGRRNNVGKIRKLNKLVGYQ